MNELKVFTLKEANQLLPALTKLILELQAKRDLAVRTEVQIDSLELISDLDESPEKEMFHLTESYRQIVREFYAIVDQIHELGCFLKDVDLGLIDFYGIVNSQVVYLCWHLGESEISYWHETEQGFASRQPLIPD